MSRPTFEEHALRNWKWAAGVAAFGLGWLLEWLLLGHLLPSDKPFWTSHGSWGTALAWGVGILLVVALFGADPIAEILSAMLAGDYSRCQQRQKRMVFAIRGFILGWLSPLAWPPWLESVGALLIVNAALFVAWWVATARYRSDEEWIHLHRKEIAVCLIPGRQDELGRTIYEASTRWDGSVLTSAEVLRKEGVEPARFENGARIHRDYLDWWLSETSLRGDLKIESVEGLPVGVPGPSGLLTVTDREGNFAWVEPETLRRVGVL